MKDVINRLMENGKYTIGFETTLKALKRGKVKMVLVSVNCPKEKMKAIEEAAKDVEIVTYPGTSLELGEACGKPFPVSAIAFEDLGGISISEIEG